MWLGQLDGFKTIHMTIKNVIGLKNLKTTSYFFKKYWAENILDWPRSTPVNLPNPQPKSWDWDNPIESK
jgi:hypothetical protein